MFCSPISTNITSEQQGKPGSNLEFLDALEFAPECDNTESWPPACSHPLYLPPQFPSTARGLPVTHMWTPCHTPATHTSSCLWGLRTHRLVANQPSGAQIQDGVHSGPQRPPPFEPCYSPGSTRGDLTGGLSHSNKVLRIGAKVRRGTDRTRAAWFPELPAPQSELHNAESLKAFKDLQS